MEIILLQDVDNLGYKDDVVKVKPGYARNYLIPQKLALIANRSNTKALEEKLRQQENKRQKMLEEFKNLAEKVNKATIKIGAKVGTSGKIFGSITPLQLAESIRETTGVEVDRKKLRILDEVKNIGTYNASAELHKDVVVNFEFEVVAE
jgi:large subunit ribosomal protein L9